MHPVWEVQEGIRGQDCHCRGKVAPPTIYLTLSLHSQANIDKAVADCDKVKAVHKQLSDEKNELNLALQSGLTSFEWNPPIKTLQPRLSSNLISSSGGSAVQDIIDKTNRLEGNMNDLQKQVDQTKARIKAEDDTINGIQQAGSKVTMEATRLRDEIKNLEATIEKCEEDKNTKDSQIRTLRDEISHQGDLIGKLGKEKKSTGESRQKVIFT